MEEKSVNTIVTTRGTAEGLIFRLDGQVSKEELKASIKDYVDARKTFVEGSNVILEWLGSVPNDEYVSSISDILAKDYNITIKGSRLKSNIVKEKTSKRIKESKEDDNTGLSLFDGLGCIDDNISSDGLSKDTLNSDDNDLTNSKPYLASSSLSGQTQLKNSSLNDTSLKGSYQSMQTPGFLSKNVVNNNQGFLEGTNIWDEANTRIICTTLRSGQKVETEHSLVVLGDVNSGAEIIAGGDVVVLGTLRGIAHAGAYDELGGGRVIFALDLRPTQLRIGSIISRDGNDGTQKVPEIAHVDGDIIVVEPYNSRSWKRKG